MDKTDKEQIIQRYNIRLAEYGDDIRTLASGTEERRRIRYKVKIDHPTLQEYELIFKKMCESNGITFKKEVFDYLIKDYYRKFNVKLNACHPRDIIENIVDDAHYHNCSPDLTKETVSAAWENYFVEMWVIVRDGKGEIYESQKSNRDRGTHIMFLSLHLDSVGFSSGFFLL